ncbi:MAG: hypothetical protein WA125_10325 [Desulfosporosinus sp.]
MSYRNGNYSAFYVDEPFIESNLGASATKDFITYRSQAADNKMTPQFLKSLFFIYCF